MKRLSDHQRSIIRISNLGFRDGAGLMACMYNAQEIKNCLTEAQHKKYSTLAFNNYAKRVGIKRQKIKSSPNYQRNLTVMEKILINGNQKNNSIKF